VTVLLQISDPHFGTERLPVVVALVRLSLEQQPDLVVVSGDITQRARRGQFEAARTFLERLGKPWLAIPGNHDIPLFDLRARVLRPYARHCEAFGPDLEPEHDAPELLVLGVNTTRWYRHQDGEVSSAQIGRVARRLQRAGAAQLRVVVVHQPVAVPQERDVHNLLRGHAAALRDWAVAGCDLVMGGHIHLPYVAALPGLARPMWAVQAGTAVSWRVRDGIQNSVNLLRWGRDAPAGLCLIERWDCSATGPAFIRSAVVEVTPDRAALGH
jgi:3',5'-cyclic AMP phosphodiesterase CpdA